MDLYLFHLGFFLLIREAALLHIAAKNERNAYVTIQDMRINNSLLYQNRYQKVMETHKMKLIGTFHRD